jgi:rhodanese-related sulfurtransferase
VVTPIHLPALRELLTARAQLVEVLPADEYSEQHLPGAISIPLKTSTRPRPAPSTAAGQSSCTAGTPFEI